MGNKKNKDDLQEYRSTKFKNLFQFALSDVIVGGVSFKELAEC